MNNRTRIRQSASAMLPLKLEKHVEFVGDIQWMPLLSEDEANRKWLMRNCTLCEHEFSDEDLDDGPKCPSCNAMERTRTMPILMHYLQKMNQNWFEGEYLAFALTNLEEKIIRPHYGELCSVSLYGSYRANHQLGMDIRDLSRFEDRRFCATFSCLIFDYLTEHDKALRELNRVIKNEGVFITHIANYRLSDSDDEPVETGRISAGPDSFTYLGDDTIPSINVGKEWFFRALDRAGFTPGLIAIRDPPTEEYFLWFVGIKRAQ